MPGTLLVAAHGTRDPRGIATVRALIRAISASRPGLPVSLGFLDVLGPTLAEALASLHGPVVVVPALLSTGYHVTKDIPAVAQAAGPTVAVSAHLGPDRLLSRALADRLTSSGSTSGPVALVAAGSSDPHAAAEVRLAAADLADLLGRRVIASSATDPALDSVLASVGSVAPYLLAEGYFADAIRTRARGAGVMFVADVLGAHPAVVEVVLARYDAALR